MSEKQPQLALGYLCPIDKKQLAWLIKAVQKELDKEFFLRLLLKYTDDLHLKAPEFSDHNESRYFDGKLVPNYLRKYFRCPPEMKEKFERFERESLDTAEQIRSISMDIDMLNSDLEVWREIVKEWKKESAEREMMVKTLIEMFEQFKLTGFWTPPGEKWPDIRPRYNGTKE